MAVNLQPPHRLFAVAGTSIQVLEAGLRYKDRSDLVLIGLDDGSITSAVFTQNKFAAAPVQVAQQHLRHASPRFILINAGNANAGTGRQGVDDAIATCHRVANAKQIDKEQVIPFSTGVIGELFEMPLYASAIDRLVSAENADWLQAAEAIMTTDTVAKAVSQQVEIGGKLITITGIAKGSGMISPDMATMLSFIATDALIAQDVLDQLVLQAVGHSFNRITVDSDTSTNDAVTVSATGRAQNQIIDQLTAEPAKLFYSVLEAVMLTLAHSIVRDGEGATKFVKVCVKNGASIDDCRDIAFAVANSPLVKTALYACDPNWGRLLMAIGKAQNAHIDQNRMSLQINDVELLVKGSLSPTYSESQGQAAFAQEEIEITIDLAVGDSEYHVWTSDLSHEYVSINADYRS